MINSCVMTIKSTVHFGVLGEGLRRLWLIDWSPSGARGRHGGIAGEVV